MTGSHASAPTVSAWRLHNLAAADLPHSDHREDRHLFPNELFRYGVNQSLIPIAAPQVDIAVGRQRNEIASADLHDRDIKGTAPQIVNQDLSRYIRHSPSADR